MTAALASSLPPALRLPRRAGKLLSMTTTPNTFATADAIANTPSEFLAAAASAWLRFEKQYDGGNDLAHVVYFAHAPALRCFVHVSSAHKAWRVVGTDIVAATRDAAARLGIAVKLAERNAAVAS